MRNLMVLVVLVVLVMAACGGPVAPMPVEDLAPYIEPTTRPDLSSTDLAHEITPLCRYQADCDEGAGGPPLGGVCLYVSCAAPLGTCQPFGDDGGTCGGEGDACCHRSEEPRARYCKPGLFCAAGARCVKCPPTD